MVGNKPKKSNRIGTLVTVLAIGIVVVTVTAAVSSFPAATVTIPTTIIQSAEAYGDPTTELREPKAPMAVSQDGNNVYIVWWTNKSGN
jgi:hypothetical protein